MTVPTRMTLAGVLTGVALRGELVREWSELRVAGLEYDSRKVEKDTLFFAFQGARVDGRQFAREAVARTVARRAGLRSRAYVSFTNDRAGGRRRAERV